jgi:hypothetical protein
MVRGCVRGASDHEGAATKVLRDTKFWRKKGSTKGGLTAGRATSARRALAGEGTRTILCEVGNVNSLRPPQDGSSPQCRLATWELTLSGDRLLDRTIRWAYPARLRCGPGKALVAVGAVTKTFTTPSMESHSRSLLTRSDEPNETDWSCAMWPPGALRPRPSTGSPISATRSMNHLPRSTEGPSRTTGIRSKRPGSTEPAR